ncbi:hypothetical protein B9Z55_004411 [Caenorhabditis nigoni]|uniref:Uncharacterized protein n=1 Tax=Caenorhabditis nigoni TaxID=1611254 RepID=A0A2G5UW76_9PELO|nr:hypothetical protein B9Z55_004411 [Caenorhabditis nigoni]
MGFFRVKFCIFRREFALSFPYISIRLVVSIRNLLPNPIVRREIKFPEFHVFTTSRHQFPEKLTQIIVKLTEKLKKSIIDFSEKFQTG